MPADVRPSRRYATAASIGVLLVLLVAAILGRRDPLGPPSLWLDDAWVSLPSRAQDTWEAIQTAAFSAPGFIAVLTGWLRTVGFSEQAAQMPAFVAGILGAPVMVVAFRRLRLPMAGALVAAAVVLAGPAHLDFSTRVKPYTSEVLVVTLIMATGWHLSRRPTEVRSWVQVAAASVLGLALSAAAVPAIVGAYAAGAHGLLRRRQLPWRNPDVWIGPAIAVAALQAFAGVWWIWFLRRAAANESLVDDWTSGFVDRTDLGTTLSSIVDLCAGSLRAVSSLPPGVSALLVLASAAAMAWRRWWGPLVLLGTPLVAALGLAYVGRVPLGGYRTDTWATAMFALTLGSGVSAALPRHWRQVRELGPPPLQLLVAAVVAFSLPASGLIANGYPDSDIDELVVVAEVGRRPGDIIVVHTASTWAYALYSEEPLRLVPDDRAPNGFHPEIDDRRTILLRPARDPRMVVEPRLGPILDRIQGERRLCLVGSHYNRYWGILINRVIRDGLVIEHEIQRDGGSLVCWHRPS